MNPSVSFEKFEEVPPDVVKKNRTWSQRHFTPLTRWCEDEGLSSTLGMSGCWCEVTTQTDAQRVHSTMSICAVVDAHAQGLRTSFAQECVFMDDGL